MTTKQPNLVEAYQFCQNLAESHYENFPVASLLLPQQLNDYSHALLQISEQDYQGSDPIFIALADVIQTHDLPAHLFDDLLSAFKQDVVTNRYANFADVLDYCTRSANPVGRLLLLLDGKPTQAQLEQSDAICSALQLINFYQDIVQDYNEQDRVYIPQDELANAGLIEADLIQTDTQKIAPLLRSLYQRTHALMQQGYPLGNSLSGRLGWEIRAMTLGGITTLNILMKQADGDLLTRPRLHKQQLLLIMLQSGFKYQYMNMVKNLLKNSP